MKKTLIIIFVTLLVCAGFIFFKLASFEKSGESGDGSKAGTNSAPVKKQIAVPTKTIGGNLNLSGNLDNITTAPEARWKTYSNSTYGFSVGYPYGTSVLENGVAGADVNFNDGNVEVLIVGGSFYCKESLNTNETEKVANRTFRVSRTPYTSYYYYQYSSSRCFRFIFRQLGKDVNKVNGLITSYLTTFKVINVK